MSLFQAKKGVPLIKEKVQKARKEIGENSPMLKDIEYLLGMVEKGHKLAEQAMKARDGIIVHSARKFFFDYYGEEKYF